MDRHIEMPFDRDSWDSRYQSSTGLWSGRPNTQLVTETTSMPPTTALDAGCGEGGDAVWLAAHGWQVTAVDFAETAVKRGAAQAESLGVAERIRWGAVDLTEWVPEEQYGLVTSFFLHLPAAQRQPIFRRLGAAVAPGGTLLIVGHHPADVGGHGEDMFFLGEDVAGVLDGEWAEVRSEVRTRDATIDGAGFVVRDVVVVARKE